MDEERASGKRPGGKDNGLRLLILWYHLMGLHNKHHQRIFRMVTSRLHCRGNYIDGDFSDGCCVLGKLNIADMLGRLWYPVAFQAMTFWLRFRLPVHKDRWWLCWQVVTEMLKSMSRGYQIYWYSTKVTLSISPCLLPEDLRLTSRIANATL
jgi:hypothetical protein